MGNLWQYKNHHYKSKYYIVLLQEHSEINQFKSGHPVYPLSRSRFRIFYRSYFNFDYFGTVGQRPLSPKKRLKQYASFVDVE